MITPCSFCRKYWSDTCPMCSQRLQSSRVNDEAMQRAIRFLEGSLPKDGRGQVILPSDPVGIVRLIAQAMEHATREALGPLASQGARETASPEEELAQRFGALELEDKPLSATGIRGMAALLGDGLRSDALRLELDDAPAVVPAPSEPSGNGIPLSWWTPGKGTPVEENFFNEMDELQIHMWLKANEHSVVPGRDALVRTLYRRQRDRITFIGRSGSGRYTDGLRREAASDLGRIRDEERRMPW